MEIKPGGTSGGEKSFIFGIGLILLALGVYLLLDSVRVSSAFCFGREDDSSAHDFNDDRGRCGFTCSELSGSLRWLWKRQEEL